MRVAFRNFTGGEVSPQLAARYDLQKSGTFAQCMLNMVPNVHGDVERRPGTKFILNLGGPCVLLPFQYNSSAGKNYVLAFTESDIRVYSATGGLHGTMSNPYSLTDVPKLSFVQVGRYVYIAHRKYCLRKITWGGTDSTWSLDAVTLNKSISAPSKPTVAWKRGPKDSDSDTPYTKNETYTLSYVVTSIDKDGVESVASEVGEAEGRYPTDWVQGDRVLITWHPVAGAEEYNIYRDSAGYYGYIGSAKSTDLATDESSGVANVKVDGEVFILSTQCRLTEIYTNSGYEDGEELTGYKVNTSASGKLYNSFVNTAMGQRLVYSGKKWALVDSATENATVGASDVHFNGWVANSGQYPSGNAGGVSIVPTFNTTVNGDIGFTDNNFEPDTAQTPREDWDPFEGGNHPSCVALHQQRLVLAGTKNGPATIYMSRTGDYENFRKARPVQDDDPVEYMIASGSIDDIQWIDSFGDVLIGTAGAEYQMSASGAAITPSDCQIKTQSYWGSSGVQPLIIGTSVIHCQRGDSHVRDLFYSWENDGYSGRDLSLLAPHLMEGHSVVQMVYQQSPGSTIWIVRDDGVLLGLTYLSEQKVYAWSRHVTDGKVKSACCICGNGEDIVMMVVERKIGNTTKYMLERLSGRFKDSDAIEDAWFVDCGVLRTPTTDDDGRKVIVDSLGYLNGKKVVVLADGAPEEHVVEGGKVTLTFPADKAIVGLNYQSVMSPMPVESDTQNGSTLGKRRAYGKVVMRLYRSVGGKWGGTGEGNLFDHDAWKSATLYDIPFLPGEWGKAVQPYSGDVEVSMGNESSMNCDSSIWIVQDRPLPLRIVALMCDVDFGEM